MDQNWFHWPLFHFFYTSKVQKMNQRERNAVHAGGQLMLACQAKHEAAPVIVLMIGKTDKVKCIMKQELKPPE